VRSAVAIVVLLAACDQIYGLRDRPDARDGSDGNEGDATMTDAPCTLDDFDSSTTYPILPFGNGTYHPAMSADGLELFHVVLSSSLDLRVSKRETISDPWSAGAELENNISSPLGNDADPTITADGTALLFVSTRAPATPFTRNIYETIRPVGGEWTPPVRRGGIDVEAYSIDISADGKTLYVIDGDTPSSKLYRFERAGIGQDFTARMPVRDGTRFPSISADQTELYFHDDEGIKREKKVNGMFVNPQLLVAGEIDGDLSHDGMILTYRTAAGLSYIKRGCVVPQ
jgi:hypothetical protein